MLSKTILLFLASHSVDFWVTSKDLPNPENRVTLDKDGQIILTVNEGMLDAMELHPNLLERNLYLGKNIPIGARFIKTEPHVLG